MQYEVWGVYEQGGGEEAGGGGDKGREKSKEREREREREREEYLGGSDSISSSLITSSRPASLKSIF